MQNQSTRDAGLNGKMLISSKESGQLRQALDGVQIKNRELVPVGHKKFTPPASDGKNELVDRTLSLSAGQV